MTVNQTKPKSILATFCFCAAGYCCVGALLVFFDQALLWFREGAWPSYRLWVILDLAGWQQAPQSPVARLQPWLDQAWETLSNCPITIAFSVATIVFAGLGFARQSAFTREVERRRTR